MKKNRRKNFSTKEILLIGKTAYRTKTPKELAKELNADIYTVYQRIARLRRAGVNIPMQGHGKEFHAAVALLKGI